MKVSKVNHTNSAVGKNEQKVNGMLYHFPNASGNGVKQLKQHVQDVNKKAQNLYSIFVPVQKIEKEKKDLYGKLIGDFKILIKTAVLRNWNPDREIHQLIEKQLQTVKNYNVEKIYNFENWDVEIVIKDFVILSLRASLKKEIKTESGEKVFAPDIVTKLLYAFAQGSSYKKELLNIPDEHLKALFKLINEDYGKTKQINNIVKSIEQQSVKVQYNTETNKLQLANAAHHKKKWIFEFIKDYAGATEEIRKKMLRHMRALILLFYCGADKYEDAENGGVLEWSFETLQEDVSVDFADVIGLISQKEQAKGDKAKRKELTSQIKRILRNTIIQRYREAVAVKGITEADKFWIEYFENCAEKILLSKNDLSLHKVSVAYLCNQTWKEWISFIAMKYIDMGKAVYHFATPNYADIKMQKDVAVGEVLPEFKNGITSFDYERIKADETVEREISRYITFAINNFATAVMKENERKKGNNEDVLNEKLKLDTLKDDVDRRILQYFGGKSTWTDYSFESNALFSVIQKELAYIRNNHFHYAGDGENMQKETSSIIDEMFQKEYFELGMKYRKKYYSNNVPKFYSVENITALMDRLYDEPAIRPAQVPSFQKILSRNTFKTEIANFVKGKPLGKVTKTPEMAEEFRSSLYFVLKEIYYYDFLQLEDLKTRFMEALKIMDDNERDKTKQKAMKNFMERVNEIDGENVTFEQLCQQVMTDYEQQNNEKEKKASGYAVTYMDKNENLAVKLKKTEDDKKIYKHFKSLLYLGLKEAFWHYLNPKGKDETEERFFQFLREPVNRQQEFENLSEEKFYSDWELPTYDIPENGNTLAWFTVAHFLNPKQLNHLIGCIKNYIQYIENIDKRAKTVGNRTDGNISKKSGYYNDILIMLDFCMPFCGQISNVLEDYYKDADDYAEHLAKYVNFTSKKLTGKAALQAFCNKSVKIEKQEFRYGIYFDGLKPIVNRNVVMAMLYGAESVLANSISPITEEDLRNYYKNKVKLSELFKNGVCKTKEEYQALREFQNLKNRVELVDIMIFSEILSDLMGQLIGFAYLRERDLMYMQLGFQYVKLFHTESVEKDSLYRKLNGSEVSIMDGAILYQIVAIYSYHLPVFTLDENGEAKIPDRKGSTGRNIGLFTKVYSDTIYNEGLCFFEDIHMHGYIIEFRNYIDHFKYYAKTNKSMLDMYSQMYDSFFDYDLKLKKSVSFVLSNTLMKYFIVPKLSFDKTGEKSYKPEGSKEKITKKATKIAINELNSDIFTFNLSTENGKNTSFKKKEVVLAEARSSTFLEQVKKILEFSK